MRLNVLALSVFLALPLAGCTTSQGVSVSADQQIETTRNIVGNELVGAKGATPADQDAIDSTAAGLCGAKVWTPAECQKHGSR